MLQCLLSGEKHSENVCIKHFVELLLGGFFERDELVNAGVVDHDVDLTERFLRFRKKLFDFAFFVTLPWIATALPPPLLISSTTRSASCLEDA